MGWPAKAWVPKSALELLVWTVGAMGSPCCRGLCLWEPWGSWGALGYAGPGLGVPILGPGLGQLVNGTGVPAQRMSVTGRSCIPRLNGAGGFRLQAERQPCPSWPHSGRWADTAELGKTRCSSEGQLQPRTAAWGSCGSAARGPDSGPSAAESRLQGLAEGGLRPAEGPR